MRDSISHAMMSEEEAKTVTQTLKKNAYVLQRMVLMLFDSSDEGAMEELKSRRNEYVACKAIAQESINHTYNHFPNLTITLNCEVSDTLCIFTNRVYLMRSIRELLYNAAKYSDGKNISLSITETVNTVYFIVQDTGPGISEVSYDDVFMPFTKIDDLSEGLGLGLPLAKRHAISLGGNLTLDTDYHKGCRFFLSVAK
jgi:signal transduction histidine kinase